jgi:glycosyltransferase involved in cell wall biosynthesis
VVNTAVRLGEFAPEFEKAGYSVLHYSYKKGIVNKFVFYKKIWKFIDSENIDVIHNHHLAMYMVLSAITKIKKLKSVFTFHNVYPSKWYTHFYHKWKRRVSSSLFHCKMHTISDSVYWHEKNFYQNESFLINNWYDNTHFSSGSHLEKMVIREEIGVASEAFVIISIGGCSHIKQHHDIITILPQLITEIPEIIYLHLGEGNTLEEEMNIARELGIENHIRFIGNKRNVRKYLVASDLYLMPSKFEGISLTTIEALACKIPSILYDVPGLKDFNIDSECSILIEDDSNSLLGTILNLKSDFEKQDLIKNNGEELVKRKYFLESNVKCIFSIYS